MSEKVYEVGDKVRIRKDLKKLYMNGESDYGVTHGMLHYANDVAFITKVFSDGSFHITLDGGRWCWGADCTSEASEENDLVEVPQWFDEWYNTLKGLNVYPKEAKLLAIHKINQQGYGCGFTDPLKILGGADGCPWEQHSEEDLYTAERAGYVNNHKLDLISAVINGYTVIKEPNLYNIPLPYLTTSEGDPQYLSARGLPGSENVSFFACPKNARLKQAFTKEELNYIPSDYKQYVKKVQDD